MSRTTRLDGVASAVIGPRLAEARRRAGLRQHHAQAALGGMSRPTFIAIEKGKREATAQEIVTLCGLYKCQVSEIMGGTAARLTKTDPLGMLAEIIEWIRRYDAGNVSEGQLAAFLNTDRLGARIMREAVHAMVTVAASHCGPLGLLGDAGAGTGGQA